MTGVAGGSGAFLLMIAAFYGGELVWRERDRKVNELIDSTAVPSWVMTVPKMLAIFLILLIVNVAAALTGMVYQLVEGARVLGIPEYLAWFIVPAAIDGLLIAILAVFVQVLSPNKYLGWDPARLVRQRHLSQQHGLCRPAVHVRRHAAGAAQRLRRGR